MAETARDAPWTGRAIFLAVALGVIFFALLPLETGPPRWAPPDLLLALCFAWSVRRPDQVPTLSIAAVALLADLLFQRPPGLFAGLTVLACAYLRSRARNLRVSGFWVEWLTVGTVTLLAGVAYRACLALLAVPQPPLGLSLVQAISTVAAYPAVVLVAHVLLGLRRPAPSDPAGTGSGQ